MFGVYSDNPGLRGLSASGAYGDMDPAFYLQKIQSTPTSYQEDAESVDNYMRGLMKDFRPDTVYLESDTARRSDDRGGGPHSEQILNLRHGGFAGDLSDPYLPDGTFLDFQFLERDPRGIATQPDMRKHMEQQYARGAFIKFSPDDDFSVPEIGINPTQMVSNIKSGMYQFKDRYKNFEESFDGWTNGYQGISRHGGNDIAKMTPDGTIMDLTEASVRNRRDAVSQLSDDPTIAYRWSTPDQRVKIARYGIVRVSQDKNYQNWDNNRKSTFLDHANMAIIDGTRVNRMLARLIVDLEGLRDNKQLVAQGAAYGDSSVNQQAKKKLSPVDIYKIIRIGGFNTHAATANEFFEGDHIHKYGNKPMNNQRVASQNIQVNHEITKSMEQATKKQRARDKEGFVHLRKKIEESASENGIYNEAKNRRMTEGMRTSNMTRNVEDNRHIEDQKEIKNYSGITPSRHRKTYQNSQFEKFGNHSLNTKERSRKGNSTMYKAVDNNEYDLDQGRLDFGTYDKANKEDSKLHMGRDLQHTMDFGDTARLDEAREVDMHMFALN